MAAHGLPTEQIGILAITFNTLPCMGRRLRINIRHTPSKE